MPFTSVLSGIAVSFQGMIADSTNLIVDTFVNGESSAEIPFGVCVKQGTDDAEAVLLTAITDKLVGIVLHSNAYNKTNEVGSTGIKPDVVMNVARKGVVWVPVEEAVTPASAVLVRAVATGGEQAGAFRDTADASDLIDVSAFCRFRSTTTGAGLVKLEFDFTMRGADPID
jgi:hypothetical protein